MWSPFHSLVVNILAVLCEDWEMLEKQLLGTIINDHVSGTEISTFYALALVPTVTLLEGCCYAPPPLLFLSLIFYYEKW